jgi:hypothetical protein
MAKLQGDTRTERWSAALASNGFKEGKGAIKWARLSCRSFAANAVRLQIDALVINARDLE